jgi:trimethylamine--corrinoid protein Co-methyltransferase
MSNSISRRAGGRTARRNARSAPLADHLRPVKAGMLGGSYSPLITRW